MRADEPAANAGGGSAMPFGLWERKIATRYLRATRSEGGVALISIIAYAGITLAVAVLIIVMSIMNGFRQEILSKFLGIEGHLFVVTVGLTPGDVDAMSSSIRGLDGVERASGIVMSPAGVISDYDFAAVQVRGLSAEDLAHHDFLAENIETGSLVNFGVGENGGDGIIIGRGLAREFGVVAGDEITLMSPRRRSTPLGSAPTTKRYRVLATITVGHYEFDNVLVYMPIEQARIFMGRGESTDYIEVRLDNPDDVVRARAWITDAVGPGYYIEDWRNRHLSMVEALNVERNVMRLILMLIVLIAALNIISGLVMLVKNKGRDIAILRTMGSTQGGVMRIFLMTGTVVGFAGTITGVILGVLFCLNIEGIQAAVEWVFQVSVFNPEVYFLENIPAEVETGEVILVAFWGLVASCLATLLPAWRAARLDPVEALRYE